MQAKEMVYPGHPVVIAYLITQQYPNYHAAAGRDPGSHYERALVSCEIPGAGSHVGAALDLLHFLCNGISWEMAINNADNFWEAVTKGNTAIWGQQQAEQIKPLLKAKSAWWSKGVSSVTISDTIDHGPHFSEDKTHEPK